MNLKKIIGAILIIISLGVGYLGVNKVSESQASVEVLGLNLKASHTSGQQEGYIYLGVAALLFIGGLVAINKK